MDNIKGPTAAFTTFSPFESTLARKAKWLVLKLAPRNAAKVREQEFLHSAHFSRISPKQLERAGLGGDDLKFGAFLFMSAYNGDAEAYFRGFSERLHEVMNDLWNGCLEWHGAKQYANLEAFIGTWRRRSLTFFNAYPDTSKRQRASLTLRRELDKVHAAAFSSGGDQVFQRAFDRAAQLHWGNAKEQDT